MLYKMIVAASIVAFSSAAPVEDVRENIESAVEAVERGRELFPLYAVGAKHRAATRAHKAATGVHMTMGEGVKGPIKTLEMLALNDDLNTVVSSDNMCTRRHAMARAAGLAAGLSMAAVSAPGFAAGSANVKMGSDSGQLVFVPDEVKICAGDSVVWKNNKGGPHNVVFDEENIPAGVDQEKISMDDQLGDEGATFTMKLDKAGTYGYYCEPHRGAGMVATVIVS